MAIPPKKTRADKRRPLGEFNPPVRDCISLTEAAEYAGCSRSNLHTAVTRGTLKAVQRAGNWLTTKDAVDEYFRRDRLDWLNKHQRIERHARICSDWTCQRCGRLCTENRGSNRLYVYYKDRDDQNQVPENMILLCWPCYDYAMRNYHPQQMLLPGMELPEWIR
jgi:hypothetical protein